MKKIILTGDRPTGRLHIGHYVGSLAERVKIHYFYSISNTCINRINRLLYEYCYSISCTT